MIWTEEMHEKWNLMLKVKRWRNVENSNQTQADLIKAKEESAQNTSGRVKSVEEHWSMEWLGR